MVLEPGLTPSERFDTWRKKLVCLARDVENGGRQEGLRRDPALKDPKTEDMESAVTSMRNQLLVKSFWAKDPAKERGDPTAFLIAAWCLDLLHLLKNNFKNWDDPGLISNQRFEPSWITSGDLTPPELKFQPLPSCHAIDNQF
jgi:hypothetical protein